MIKNKKPSSAEANNTGKRLSNAAHFQIGEKIVYPSHGLGEIVALENIVVAGVSMQMYKIYFAKDNMHSFIPSHKLREEGVRKLCSKEMVHKVLEILTKPCKTNRSTWSKRVQEYEMKMYSGSIMLVAEMIRSLFGGVGDPNRSYGERVIYENAFYRVSSEIAAVLKQDIKQIEIKMVEILSDTKQKIEKNQKLEALEKLTNDDFDD